MAAGDEARRILYTQIAEAAKDNTNSRMLRELAEAFAWLTSPNQPHGGQASDK